MHRVTAAQMIHLRYSLADRRRKKRCIFRDKKKRKKERKNKNVSVNILMKRRLIDSRWIRRRANYKHNLWLTLWKLDPPDLVCEITSRFLFKFSNFASDAKYFFVWSFDNNAPRFRDFQKKKKETKTDQEDSFPHKINLNSLERINTTRDIPKILVHKILER